MSLYRVPTRVAARRLALAAVVGLVIGLAVGYFGGRASKDDPSLSRAVGQLRDDLKPATQGIELAPTEYAQGVRGGRVVEPTEYKAAQADMKRAEDAIASVRGDLEALGPGRAGAFQRAVDALARAIGRKAPAAEVRRLSRVAAAAQSAAVGR